MGVLWMRGVVEPVEGGPRGKGQRGAILAAVQVAREEQRVGELEIFVDRGTVNVVN
jgi:hypothetical protein